jgi:hypothetical protein
MDNLFIVVFEDNQTFLGGNDLYNTKWSEIPNKKIKSLYYRMPSGDYLLLTGYDKYYHMVEGTKAINGINAEQLMIHNIRLMAQKDKLVKIYKFNLLNDDKPIEIETKTIGDEFIKKLNLIYWK